MKFLNCTAFIIIILGFLAGCQGHALAGDFPAKEVYETFSPAVVIVRASGLGREGMIGAGVIVSNKGLIITNAHVVVDKESKMAYPEINVYLKPGHITGNPENDMKKVFKSSLFYYSTSLDLAILKASGLPSDVHVIGLADPSEIKVGEEVVAIGHPEEGGFWSLTYGRISGELSDFQGVSGKDVYQTDTNINRGNSGGPLLDKRGLMVAVNSNIARVGKDGMPITGVNFAIKSSVVKRWMEGIGEVVSYVKETGIPKNQGITMDRHDKDLIKREDDEKILTQKRPYNYDNLLIEAERELEDMIKGMRNKQQKIR